MVSIRVNKSGRERVVEATLVKAYSVIRKLKSSGWTVDSIVFI